MLVHFAISGIVCGFLLVGTRGYTWLGPGKWTVLNLQNCEDDANMPWRLDLKRHKYNRTHDAYDFDFLLLDDLDDSCGLRLIICKVVDGGCKYFSTRSFESLPKFLNTFIGKGNVDRGLAAFNLDPPVFPIPKGAYHLDGYNLDMADLRNKMVYGEYGSQSYVTRDGVDVACLQVFVKFEKTEEARIAFLSD